MFICPTTGFHPLALACCSGLSLPPGIWCPPGCPCREKRLAACVACDLPMMRLCEPALDVPVVGPLCPLRPFRNPVPSMHVSNEPTSWLPLPKGSNKSLRGQPLKSVFFFATAVSSDMWAQIDEEVNASSICHFIRHEFLGLFNSIPGATTVITIEQQRRCRSPFPIPIIPLSARSLRPSLNE